MKNALIFLILFFVLILFSCNKDDSSNKYPGTENQACNGLTTITYEGKTYNTIKIGTQCWMRENLNVGAFVYSTPTTSVHSSATDNGIIEKYCYENDENNCDKFGALYDWDELMGYTRTDNSRGICPEGWHVPSDSDYFKLECNIDTSFHNINLTGWRGHDAGLNLQNRYTSGFDALMGGMRDPHGSFMLKNEAAYFWSSSESNVFHVYYRNLYTIYQGVYRNAFTSKQSGLSVRCLKD